MKKIISILIATIMMVAMFTVPTYAQDLYEGDFSINIKDGSEKIVISWDEFYGAEYYTVSIQTPNEYNCISENTTETSFNWNPDYFITPEDVFEITVYACDNSGTVIAQSNVVELYIVIMRCDNIAMYGDLDNDQMVTVMDATIVQKHLAKAYPFDVMQKQMADVDSDGYVVDDTEGGVIGTKANDVEHSLEDHADGDGVGDVGEEEDGLEQSLQRLDGVQAHGDEQRQDGGNRHRQDGKEQGVLEAVLEALVVNDLDEVLDTELELQVSAQILHDAVIVPEGHPQGVEDGPYRKDEKQYDGGSEVQPRFPFMLAFYHITSPRNECAPRSPC